MNKYDEIMEPTGNKNKVILTSNNIFSNSDCMFIEYNDVINSPYYVFILNLIRNENASEYFNFMNFNKNTQDLEGELFEWYINRKYINPFLSIGLKPIMNEKLHAEEGDYEENRAIFLNRFLFESMVKSPEVFSSEGYLNFTNTLLKIIQIRNLVKKIIIYSERYYEGIMNDITSLYGDNVEYKYGDLIEILSDDNIPHDTTYVFSDVNKVYALKDTNRINEAAILIADRFGYNYDNNGKLLLNMSVFENDVFTLNTFDNVHQLL